MIAAVYRPGLGGEAYHSSCTNDLAFDPIVDFRHRVADGSGGEDGTTVPPALTRDYISDFNVFLGTFHGRCYRLRIADGTYVNCVLVVLRSKSVCTRSKGN